MYMVHTHSVRNIIPGATTLFIFTTEWTLNNGRAQDFSDLNEW